MLPNPRRRLVWRNSGSSLASARANSRTPSHSSTFEEAIDSVQEQPGEGSAPPALVVQLADRMLRFGDQPRACDSERGQLVGIDAWLAGAFVRRRGRRIVLPGS
jgi:hypothetical protein